MVRKLTHSKCLLAACITALTTLSRADKFLMRRQGPGHGRDLRSSIEQLCVTRRLAGERHSKIYKTICSCAGYGKNLTQASFGRHGLGAGRTTKQPTCFVADVGIMTGGGVEQKLIIPSGGGACKISKLESSSCRVRGSFLSRDKGKNGRSGLREVLEFGPSKAGRLPF